MSVYMYLSLSGLLGVDDGLEAVSQNTHANHSLVICLPKRLRIR